MNMLRVGSWNIHEAVPAGHREAADWDAELAQKTRQEIVEIIRECKFDLVGLQEVDFVGSESGTLQYIREYTQLKYIAQGVLSESSFTGGDSAGVAIASRFPLRNENTQGLPNPQLKGEINGVRIRMYDKGYISADVALPWGAMSMISLHAFPFHLFRRNPADPEFTNIWSKLSGDLAKFSPGPLIMCGDFNSDRRDLVWGDSGLSLSAAVAHEPTYRNESYDDVLFSSGFALKVARVIDNFSDHKLCYAELRLPG